MALFRGYGSKSAYCYRMMHDENMTARQIADDIDSTVNNVRVMINNETKKRELNCDHNALIDEARRRNLRPIELKHMIIRTVCEHNLFAAVLDD